MRGENRVWGGRVIRQGRWLPLIRVWCSCVLCLHLPEATSILSICSLRLRRRGRSLPLDSLLSKVLLLDLAILLTRMLHILALILTALSLWIAAPSTAALSSPVTTIAVIVSAAVITATTHRHLRLHEGAWLGWLCWLCWLLGARGNRRRERVWAGGNLRGARSVAALGGSGILLVRHCFE